jgi:cysteine desulfurase/selenocysteine lyase
MPRKAPAIVRWTRRKSAAISSPFPATKSAGQPALASFMAGVNCSKRCLPSKAFQGGGDMIANVDYFRSTWKEVPHKFEAGTPDFAGAVGLHAALDYLSAIGCDRIARHDEELAAYALDKLAALPGIRLFGPRKGHAGVVSFLLPNIHAHDVVTVADQRGVALRGGHHCNQPLMKKLGVESTARASFYFYNTPSEVDRLVEVLVEIQKFFGE